MHAKQKRTDSTYQQMHIEEKIMNSTYKIFSLNVYFFIPILTLLKHTYLFFLP